MHDLRIHDQKVSFFYLSDLKKFNSEKLYELWMAADPGIPRTNREFMMYDGIQVRDARSSDMHFDFHTTGFRFFHSPSKHHLVGSDLEVSDGSECPAKVRPYLEEQIELAKQQFGAHKVICFDWRLRRNSAPQTFEIDPSTPERVLAKLPAHIVHCDESFTGGIITVARHLSKTEMDEYSKPGFRMRILNFWRPLIDIVEDVPLALCDRRTVAVDEPVACDKVMEDYVDESFYLRYKPEHQWYWLPNQTRDELTAFVVWDSKEDHQYLVGPPHACFNNPQADPGAPKRESIEARFIVITRNEADD